MLEQVQSAIAGGLQASLGLYLADPVGNAASLTTAANQVDSVLVALATWPPLVPRGAAIAAGLAAGEYERVTKEALTKLSESVVTERQALERLKTDLESARATQSVADTERLDGLVRDYTERADSLVASLGTARDEGGLALEELESLVGKGKNIVAALASKAVAEDYRRNARNKAWAGWIWDGLGVVIGLVFGGFLLQHLFAEDAPTSSVPLSLTRLAVSIGGLGLAALCFHRGTMNHMEGRRAKRADLRLRTAESFMANLDPEFRMTVLQGMADRIYLQGLLDDGTDGDYDPAVLPALVEKFAAMRSSKTE